MKRKMLLLILAAMLMAVAAHAAPIIGDNDTLWTKPMSGVTGVKFHPSGETVFVTRESNEFYELAAETGELVYTYKHPLEGHVLSRPRHFDVNKAGTRVASIHIDTVFIWDYQTKVIIKRLYFNTTAVFFVNNDKYLFGFLNSTKPDEEDNLWIYDMETDEIKYHGIKSVNNSSHLTSMAVSPDGRYFALASVAKDYYNNTVNNLALYNAQTFEHIMDINQNEPTIIDEIVFSENAKWIGYKKYFSKTTLVNLEKLIQTGLREDKQFATSGIYFIGSDDFIFGLLPYESIKSSIINLQSNDTTYQINYSFSSGKIAIDNVNKRIAFVGYFPNLHENLFMLNSNWYTLDVPNEPIDSEKIVNVNYSNNLLTYSTKDIIINSISIIDSIGTTILNKTNDTLTEGNIEIALPSGIYFFTVSDGQHSYTRKFVVAN